MVHPLFAEILGATFPTLAGRKPYPMAPTCGHVKYTPLVCTAPAGHDGPHESTMVSPTIYWDAAPRDERKGEES